MATISILLSLISIEINRRTMERLTTQSPLLKFKKEHHISSFLESLKDIQSKTSEKISNCGKDKSCYSKESYKELLWQLKDQASAVAMIFGDACPDFKKDVEGYKSFVVSMDLIAQRTINPQELKDIKAPELLESKTRDLIDASFKLCEKEYALKYDP